MPQVRTSFRRAPVVLAAGAVLVLSACGGDGDSADPGVAASATAVASAASSAAASAASAAPSAAGAAGAMTPGCPQARGKVVGYSEPLPDPNFKAIETIIDTQLKRSGASLRPVNANLDPGKQIADISSLLQARVDVLIVNPIDPNATRPALDRARSQGVPIVAQETTVGGPFFANVTADVESASRQGAEALKAAGATRVGAVQGPAFAEILVRENTAFTQGAAAAGLTVVDSQTNQQITPQGAKAIADAWKQRYGADMQGVWTFNDTSAVGVASSLGGAFNPKIVSINAQPEAIPLVRDGKILATFDIQQDKIGQALAYAALAALCGQQVPSEIVVPVKKIDASTVGSWRPLDARVADPFSVTFEQRDGRTFMQTG